MCETDRREDEHLAAAVDPALADTGFLPLPRFEARWSRSVPRSRTSSIAYRQRVEPFRNEGEDFDPRGQRAVTTVPTDDPERSKTIAGRLRPGFQAGDKVIRPEIVSVHTSKK
jgi:GrpE protein